MHAIAAAREGVELRIREEGMSGRKGSTCCCASMRPTNRTLQSTKEFITLVWVSALLRKIPSTANFAWT